MTDTTGYCTIEDVGSVLQDTFEGADPSRAQVKDAIEGETDWLRKTTHRHFYDPDATASGEDVAVALPTAPVATSEEAHDIPSSPHAPRGRFTVSDARAYPKTRRGHYARVTLDRRHATQLDALSVRRGETTDDWVADPTKSEGRAGDYHLHADPHTGASHVFVDARQLAPALDYGGAVVASYQYGRAELPRSVRRAVAHRAAAALIIDEDANVQIPDAGNLINAKSKADEYREEADRLLGEYRETPIA